MYLPHWQVYVCLFVQSPKGQTFITLTVTTGPEQYETKWGNTIELICWSDNSLQFVNTCCQCQGRFWKLQIMKFLRKKKNTKTNDTWQSKCSKEEKCELRILYTWCYKILVCLHASGQVSKKKNIYLIRHENPLAQVLFNKSFKGIV